MQGRTSIDIDAPQKQSSATFKTNRNRFPLKQVG